MPKSQLTLDSGFAGFELSPTLQRGIAAAGFRDPRPIQEATIPAALSGRDVLGLAQTGTGKTAAFALPVLERLLRNRRPGPRALVLAPTRELATQIHAEIRLLAQFTPIRVVTVFGGVSANAQIEALRSRPEILVACPGRLLDLMRQQAVRLHGVEALVLDEADHMFDMGFLPDVRRILAALPAERQNLLFSATMPREIRTLADDLLRDPQVVELGHSTPPSTIEHALYPVAEADKLGLLERLLAEDGFASAIVFTRTKHRAKRLAQKLVGSGHSVVALQGNMSQNQRQRAMDGFRSRDFDVLVATDIAARGIDVQQVSHVVNFDMPGTPDAYTHRVGRTGRAERSGRAYTFVTPDDQALVLAVERIMGAPIPRRSVEGIRAIPFPVGGAARVPGSPRTAVASRPTFGSARSMAPRRRSAAAAATTTGARPVSIARRRAGRSPSRPSGSTSSSA